MKYKLGLKNELTQEYVVQTLCQCAWNQWILHVRSRLDEQSLNNLNQT